MSNSEKEARKKIRRAAINKNWSLFKQSRLGIVGLGIVLFFAFLAILQPILFLTGVWNEAVYDPVVGYEPERVNLLKQQYEQDFRLAAEEDQPRVSMRLVPSRSSY